MNKKQKTIMLSLSLIPILPSFTLPIVSCSSASTTEVSVIKNLDKINVLSTSINGYFKPSSQQTYDEQKKIYENIEYDTLPLLVKNAIDSIVSFKGGVSFDDVVEKVSINKGTFPKFGTQIIPDIVFKIILKKGYTPSKNTESNLTIPIYIEQSTSNKRSVNVNVKPMSIENKNAVSDSIKKLFDNKTISEQKQIYKSLENGLPIEQLKVLSNNINFIDVSNNSKISWNDIFSSQEVTISKEELLSNEKIPTIYIKINLNWNYLATIESSNNLVIAIDNLGNASIVENYLNITPNTDTASKQRGIDAIFNLIKSSGHRFSEQKEFYLNLDNSPYINEIKDAFNGVVNFSNGRNLINWNDAVKNIRVIPTTTNASFVIGGEIPSVKVIINLKDKYAPIDDNSKNFLTFNTGSIGNFNGKQELLVSNINDPKLTIGTNKLKELFVGDLTFDQQKEKWDSLNNKTLNDDEKNTFQDVVTFQSNGSNILWNEAVDNLVISLPKDPTFVFGGNIPPVDLTINLTNDFVSTNENLNKLTFKTKNLGSFKKGLLTISKNNNAINLLGEEISKRFNNLTQSTSDQQDIYSKLNGKNIFDSNNDILSVLKQTLSFSDGISWDDAVKSYTISSSSTLIPGKIFPPLSISIEINEGKYEILESSVSNLLFPINIPINVSSANTLIKMEKNNDEIKKFTQDLKTEIGVHTLNMEQKMVRSFLGENSLENFNSHTGRYRASKHLKLAFIPPNNLSISDVMEKYIISSNDEITLKPGQKIPTMNVLIILKKEYYVNNIDSLSFNFELGNATTYEYSVNIKRNEQQKILLESSIKSLFLNKTLQEQQGIYTKLIGSNVFNNGGNLENESILSYLKNTNTYTLGASQIFYDDIVKKYTITTDNPTLISNSPIPDITINLEFYEKYRPLGNENWGKIKIKISNIGNASST